MEFDDTFELIFTLFTKDPDFDFFDNPFIDVQVYSNTGEGIVNTPNVELEYCKDQIGSASYMKGTAQ
jgi:hypothetical protein